MSTRPNDAAFAHAIWHFLLLSAAKPLAAVGGTLRQQTGASLPPLVFWLRDFFDYDLWPNLLSRLSGWHAFRWLVPDRGHRASYGVSLLALWVIACPVAEMSWPAPAVVWQAPNRGAAPIKTSRVKAIESFLLIIMILIIYLCVIRRSIRVLETNWTPWIKVMAFSSTH
jgi:hypothetical protein